MCVVWTGDGEKVSWVNVCVLQYNRSGGWAESTAIGWAGGAHSHTLLPSLVSGVLNNYSLIF